MQSASDTDDSAGLRKELLADAKELRKLFDLYMNQLAALTGGLLTVCVLGVRVFCR